MSETHHSPAVKWWVTAPEGITHTAPLLSMGHIPSCITLYNRCDHFKLCIKVIAVAPQEKKWGSSCTVWDMWSIVCPSPPPPPPRGRVQIKMQWGFCQQDCWLWAKSCKNWNLSKMKRLKSRLYRGFSSYQAVFMFEHFTCFLNYILRYYNFLQHWRVAKLLCQSQNFILFISPHIVYVLIQEAMVNLEVCCSICHLVCHYCPRFISF